MFSWRNKQDISIFRMKKAPYLLLCIYNHTVFALVCFFSCHYFATYIVLEPVFLFSVGLDLTSLKNVVYFHSGMFRSNSLFVGGNTRKAISEGRADAIPIFLCEIPNLFRQKILNLDIAFVSVSPPDKHGFCSLGTSVDCTRSAIQNAKYIIGNNKP